MQQLHEMPVKTLFKLIQATEEIFNKRIAKEQSTKWKSDSDKYIELVPHVSVEQIRVVLYMKSGATMGGETLRCLIEEMGCTFGFDSKYTGTLSFYYDL